MCDTTERTIPARGFILLPCPLCGGLKTSLYFENKSRSYLRCHFCELVFVPTGYHLSPTEEKAEYDLHENDPADEGYRRFLSRLSGPLLERLAPGMEGLDFGCGPGPTLSLMMEEEGLRVDLYDPYYHPDRSVFERRFDFITATEVVEHLSGPGEVFEILFDMLKPGGWVGIMTKLVKDREAFARWHYIQDRTHISFYSRSTFESIAQRFGASLTFIGKDVILMQKK